MTKISAVIPDDLDDADELHHLGLDCVPGGLTATGQSATTFTVTRLPTPA